MALALMALVQCGTETEAPPEFYGPLPILEREVVLTEGADTLQPSRLQLVHDTLYVIYNGEARLDLFTPELERIRSIPLDQPESVYPTSFFVSDSEIYVCDHAKGAIVVYRRDGLFVDSFGLLPNRATPLSPLALTYFGGVLYVADIALRRVMAISMAYAPGITERGELILAFPVDTAWTLGFPSAVHVTLDGRLLIGDAGAGLVRVLTCDGRPVYTFGETGARRPIAPQGFAVDNVIDPGLQDSTSFDPSNVHTQGRYHVVDGNNAAVHMFNPLGRYLASYPSDGSMLKPSGIAIDTKNARIYIADPRAGRIFIYTYRD